MPALCAFASIPLSSTDQAICVSRCDPLAGHSEVARLFASADLYHQQRESGVPEPKTTTTSCKRTRQRLWYLRPQSTRLLQLLLRCLQSRCRNSSSLARKRKRRRGHHHQRLVAVLLLLLRLPTSSGKQPPESREAAAGA